MFKLVEDADGAGEISRPGAPQQRVTYRIRRFQGFTGEGGLPVPGQYRVEGRIEAPEEAGALIAGECVTLRLADGRSLAITLEADGRFHGEGRHPRGCACC